MKSYLTGYNGKVRTEQELELWSEWQNTDPEARRRFKAIADASIIAGHPLGFGGLFRTDQQANDTALSRHVLVTSGGCCRFQGRRYGPRPGTSHAAFAGSTYHGRTTPQDKGMACDFTGALDFLTQHAPEYGLVEFTRLKEKWHGQPREVPTSRSSYVPSTMAPLRPFPLPNEMPPPSPTKVYAPRASIIQGVKNDIQEVRALQLLCNFWNWKDAMGRNLIVDGDMGPKTEQAVRSLQRSIGILDDGRYGPRSQASTQSFLDYMVSLAG